MATAPITLYLDIPEGSHGDLEAIAEASIAWSRTIKEVAHILYPDIEIRIEVLDADEGSFGLNALVRSLNPKAKAALVGILAGAAAHFGLETVDYFYTKFLDSIFDGKPPPEACDQKEVDRIASAVERGAGKKPAEKVYRALQTDSVIVGVGISPRPEEEPKSVVPRESFQIRGGYAQEMVEDIRERTRSERIDAVLIKPVLIPNSRRKWRFQSDGAEASFAMADHQFVQRLLDGSETIPMVAGVILDVDVDVTEVFRDGVWTVKSRAITRVWGHRFDASALLPLSAENEDED